MSDRAGVVSVDVEPGLQAVGGKIDAYMRALRPFGFKAELASNISRDLDRETKSGQRSLDSLNTRKAQGELTALGTTGDRELGRLTRGVNLTGQEMAVLGGGAVAVGAKIFQGLRPAVDAAADLKETTGAAGVVFGESLGKVEQIAGGAARAVGLGRTAALQALNTFGNYADVAGKAGDESVQFSDQLVTLAADLGAAWNTSTPEAIQAIGSALRGEMDPIERYGIFLQDATLRQEALRLGLVKTTSEALQPQTKVLAANSLILQQGAKFAGTFAREAGGVNGQLKIQAAEAENAKASIGEGLTDGMAKAIAVGRGFLSVIDKIPGGLQAVGFAAAGVGAASILGGSVTSILGARKMLKEYLEDRKRAVAEIDVPTVGATPADTAATAASVGTVSAAMDGVTASSTRAGAAGTAAMAGIRTQAASTTAAVAATSTALSTLGGDVDRVRGSFADSRGLPAADFIDVEVISDSFDEIQAIGSGAERTVSDVGEAAAKASPKFSRLGSAISTFANSGVAKIGATTAATIGLGFAIDKNNELYQKNLALVTDIAGAQSLKGAFDPAEPERFKTTVEEIAELLAEQRRIEPLNLLDKIGDTVGLYDARIFGDSQEQGNRADAAKKTVEELKTALASLDEESGRTFLDAVGASMLRLGQNADEVEALLGPLYDQLSDQSAAQRGAAGIDKLGGSVDRFGFKIDTAKGKLSQFQDTVNNVTEAPRNAVDALHEQVDAREELADAEAEVARIRAGGTADAKEAAQAERDLADAVESVVTAKRNRAAAERDLADATRDLEADRAELAHVDPDRDPNRFRELSEKVRDGEDTRLDALDRVASANESVRDAEQSVTETREKQTTTTDELSAAEDRLEAARGRMRDADTNAQTALVALGDTLEEHPDLIAGTFAAIDEYGKRNGLAADEVERLKKETLFAIAAAQALAEQQAGSPVTRTDEKNTGDKEHQNKRPSTPTKSKKTAPQVISDVDAYNRGISAAASPGNLNDGDVYNDREDKPWRYRQKDNRWVAQFATGGRVGGTGNRDSELIAATPDEYVIRADTARRIGYAQLDALNDGQLTLGGNATAGAPAAVPPAPATSAAPQNFDAQILAELQGMRADIANLERVVYAPSVTVTDPVQVRPTMAEALRESRSDSWTNHGAISA